MSTTGWEKFVKKVKEKISDGAAFANFLQQQANAGARVWNVEKALRQIADKELKGYVEDLMNWSLGNQIRRDAADKLCGRLDQILIRMEDVRLMLTMFAVGSIPAGKPASDFHGMPSAIARLELYKRSPVTNPST